MYILKMCIIVLPNDINCLKCIVKLQIIIIFFT